MIDDKINDLLDEGLARFDHARTVPGAVEDIETRQPQHSSWIVLDVDRGDYGIDRCTILNYPNDLVMSLELQRLISEVVNTELLHFVRTGDIANLTVRIGPDTLGGTNLNEENDIELPATRTVSSD